MPNNITNRLTLEGEQKDIQKVFDFINNPDYNGDMYIDFDKIVPMPGYIYKGSLGREEERLFGKENCWHEWCVKHWGTKWNAYGMKDFIAEKRNGNNTIFFLTAWSGVPKLIYHLSVMFPEVTFYYSHASEDYACNCAEYTLEGNIGGIRDIRVYPNGSKKAFILAQELIPEPQYVWDDIKNGFYYTDEDDEESFCAFVKEEDTLSERILSKGQDNHNLINSSDGSHYESYEEWMKDLPLHKGINTVDTFETWRAARNLLNGTKEVKASDMDDLNKQITSEVYTAIKGWYGKL